MIKLMKYIKPFIIPLIFAIALLAAQAYGELTLPEVMSRLVDNGISKSGIDSSAPEAIRETEMDRLIQLLPEQDRQLVSKNYLLLTAGDSSQKDYSKYLKKYSALANENIYVLNTKDKDIKSELELSLGKAILVYSQMSQLPPETLAALQSGGSGGAQMQAMQESIDGLSLQSILQGTNEYLIAEYKAAGIDMDKYPMQYLFNEGSYMLLLAFLIMVCVVVESFLAGRISAGVGKNLRRDTFAKIVSFSSKEFDQYSTASLITRSTNDIQQVQNIIGMILRFVIYAPIMGVGGIFKVIKTESSMTWIIALAVGVMLVIVIIMFSVAIPKFKKIQTLIDRVNLVMRESLSGMLVIRAFSNQQLEEKKFDIANQDLTQTNLFIARVMSLMMPIMTIIMNGVSLLIIWVGASQIDAGKLQVGDMMAFIQYAMQIIMSFLMISMISMILPRAMVSAKRIAEVLDTKNSIVDPIPVATEKSVKFDNARKGIVEFSNVYFKYPGADEYVLKDITFTAMPNQTTAFIGSTGSGKSTIVNLIPRFYDASEGIIKVNGADIKKITQHTLREEIGYVPQKGVLFSGTIESNLKFGGIDITDEDMHEAADIAQAIDFINAKPEKYNEPVAQGGTNVSGGQRQRLSIARALAKKPQIYIFDDSFSALDYKTDSMLRAAIRKKLGKSTVLIVAQRIGTIKNAEQIIVLDQGAIVGKGTHRELLQNCDIYKQIALSQLSEEELERDLQNSGETDNNVNLTPEGGF